MSMLLKLHGNLGGKPVQDTKDILYIWPKQDPTASAQLSCLVLSSVDDVLVLQNFTNVHLSQMQMTCHCNTNTSCNLQQKNKKK